MMKLAVNYLVISAACLLLISGGCSRVATVEHEDELALPFNENKSFKIAQFTDIHWKNNDKETCARTAAIIRHVLEAEKPDLAVLTGDIVNEPAAGGWQELMTIFSESGIPFSVTLGNHDDEAEWSRAQIFDFLETLPGFTGEKGPADINGVGNYVIRLNSGETGKTSALLWFFDSNAYCDDKNLSDYDWIKYDQIAWYRNRSRMLSAENENQAYPSLAFFHIPLPEYNNIIGQSTTLGEYHEEVCSPRVNSGLFSAFLEMNDVKGTFVGHDHVNNYIGVSGGIALAYGQSTGGYGDLAKGSRIIELREGEAGFSTWIRTMEGVSLHYTHEIAPPVN